MRPLFSNPWRTMVLLLLGLLFIGFLHQSAVFSTHPYALLYFYVVLVVWRGDHVDVACAVALADVGVWVALPHQYALSVECLIFSAASLHVGYYVRTLKTVTRALECSSVRAVQATQRLRLPD